jgi:hypothetical protein
MASSYYGDRSNAEFYLKGPSHKKTGRNGRADQDKKQSRPDHGLLTPIPTSATNHHRAHATAKAVLKSFSDNTKRTIDKAKTEGKEGNGSKSTGKILKRILLGGPRNTAAPSWRIPKKPRTIPQPTVNLDFKIPMYLLLVEGSFSQGANRQDYLSNVYYRGETFLLPSIGRALDVLPPTKMAAGPWLVIPSKESLATLDDQSDWSGQRIRFTSPKAATTKSLHNFRVSPTTDILGSLTVAAFSGFSTSEEFQNEAQELAQKILRLNKQQDWSKSVAHLPPFSLDGKQPHCCAGGFSIAVNYDPERCTKYYLKIGICEAAQEIVCVDRTCFGLRSRHSLQHLTLFLWFANLQWSSPFVRKRFPALLRPLERNSLSEISSGTSRLVQNPPVIRNATRMQPPRRSMRLSKIASKPLRFQLRPVDFMPQAPPFAVLWWVTMILESPKAPGMTRPSTSKAQ